MARARRRPRTKKPRAARKSSRSAPHRRASTGRRASAGGASGPRPPAARAAPRIRIALPKPSRAETLLLALAKDLTAAPLDAALRRIADAFTPGAELPREVYGAWLKTRREKTAMLALSWAREQVRLSLEETIERSPRVRPPLGLAPDTLAWLLLAACEAIAHEPPSAVADRVRTVLELSGHAASAG
jgi:hypothetical protein